MYHLSSSESHTFVVPGMGYVEDGFSTDWEEGRVSGCFKHIMFIVPFQFSSVSLSCVRLFATSWTAAPQASLSFTNTQSSLRLMSIESVMPSNQLILCCALLLLPLIFPSIRVFSNESALHIRWLKYWSFSFSISPSSEHPGLIFFREGLGVRTRVSPMSSSEEGWVPSNSPSLKMKT